MSAVSPTLPLSFRDARPQRENYRLCEISVAVVQRKKPVIHADRSKDQMSNSQAAEIYRKTGNLRAVPLLLGHSKVDSTVGYLGVKVEDALSIAERIDN